MAWEKVFLLYAIKRRRLNGVFSSQHSLRASAWWWRLPPALPQNKCFVSTPASSTSPEQQLLNPSPSSSLAHVVSLVRYCFNRTRVRSDSDDEVYTCVWSDRASIGYRFGRIHGWLARLDTYTTGYSFFMLVRSDTDQTGCIGILSCIVCFMSCISSHFYVPDSKARDI